jgi:hypothetical protein
MMLCDFNVETDILDVRNFMCGVFFPPPPQITIHQNLTNVGIKKPSLTISQVVTKITLGMQTI